MKIDDLFQVVEDRAKSDPGLSWTDTRSSRLIIPLCGNASFKWGKA